MDQELEISVLGDALFVLGLELRERLLEVRVLPEGGRADPVLGERAFPRAFADIFSADG